MFEALAGAHANVLGGEGVPVVGGDLDFLAGILVGIERDVDLLARAGGGRRAAVVGIAHDTRVVELAGSVVTVRCAGRHFSRRAMIESAGSGCSGPTETRSGKQQLEGLRNSMTCTPDQGTEILVWSTSYPNWRWPSR